jgi:protein-disulfide isomerase
MINFSEIKKQLHWSVVFFVLFSLVIIILTIGFSVLIKKDEKINNPKFLLVTTDDPSAGNPEAKVQIVEFSDFQCPFCQKSSSIVRDLIQSYGDKIYFVYRDFPLKNHRYAQKSAEAGECAQDQGKFWELHDKIFANQDKLKEIKKLALEIEGLDMKKFNQCLDSNKYQEEVKQDYEDGVSAGVDGTPTFFINNELVNGAVPRAKMVEVIEKYLGQ